MTSPDLTQLFFFGWCLGKQAYCCNTANAECLAQCCQPYYNYSICTNFEASYTGRMIYYYFRLGGGGQNVVIQTETNSESIPWLVLVLCTAMAKSCGWQVVLIPVGTKPIEKTKEKLLKFYRVFTWIRDKEFL